MAFMPPKKGRHVFFRYIRLERKLTKGLIAWRDLRRRADYDAQVAGVDDAVIEESRRDKVVNMPRGGEDLPGINGHGVLGKHDI